MNFLIPILVGSVIGYFTNWLAIKMLFRPYYEKRIFGIKVPFTPGLIPKERNRIAKNVGEAVGNHLLTDEIIKEKILSSETDTYLKDIYNRGILKLKAEDKSLKECLEKTSLLDALNEDELAKEIRSYLLNIDKLEILIDNTLNSLEVNFKKEENLVGIERNLNLGINELLVSKDLRRGLEKFYNDSLLNILKSDLKFEDIISNESFVNLEIYANTHRDDMSDFLKELINNPDIRISLRKTISKAVDDNISRLITSFISTDKITEKVMAAIDNYIYDKQSKEDLSLIVGKLMDIFKEKNISILGHILKENLEEERFASILISQIGEEEVENLSSYLIESIRESDFTQLKFKLKDKLLSYMSSKNFTDFVDEEIKNIFNVFLNLSISDVFARFKMDEEKIYSKLKSRAFDLGNENLPVLLEKINIAKIVEDNINSFDLEFGEKLILDIADKELKAITWLGALLGAIMGILTPLLQMI